MVIIIIIIIIIAGARFKDVGSYPKGTEEYYNKFESFVKQMFVPLRDKMGLIISYYYRLLLSLFCCSYTIIIILL